MDKKILFEAGKTRFALARNESVNDEERSVEFVISTEAVDSYNTVFKADGWDFKRYTENPVVFYQHDFHGSNPDSLIGISEVRQEGNQTIGKVFFEPADVNPLAEKVFRKIKAGTLRGASINADVTDGRFGNKDLNEDPEILYFTRQSLLEWSIVTVPSNPEALKRTRQDIELLKKSEAKPENENGDNKAMSVYKARIINNKNL